MNEFVFAPNASKDDRKKYTERLKDSGQMQHVQTYIDSYIDTVISESKTIEDFKRRIDHDFVYECDSTQNYVYSSLGCAGNDNLFKNVVECDYYENFERRDDGSFYLPLIEDPGSSGYSTSVNYIKDDKDNITGMAFGFLETEFDLDESLSTWWDHDILIVNFSDDVRSKLEKLAGLEAFRQEKSDLSNTVSDLVDFGEDLENKDRSESCSNRQFGGY